MIEYDTATGAILCIRRMSKRAVYTPPPGTALMEGFADTRTQYVDVSSSPPTVRERMRFDVTASKPTVTADGQDEVVIGTLPIPCTVTIDDGVPMEVDDGTLEFSADAPGVYRITLEHPHYFTATYEVDAE